MIPFLLISGILVSFGLVLTGMIKIWIGVSNNPD
ncbi:YnaM/YnfT family protein [Mangrovibacter phragmitis]